MNTDTLSHLIESRPAWHRFALCASEPRDLWFTDDNHLRILGVKICRQCPVRVECLDWAMTHPQSLGTWGGTSERERRRIRRAELAGR